jgi:DNA replication and repair protein RecF
MNKFVALKRAKKNLETQRQGYDKFSDHIGFIPLVIISPADRFNLWKEAKPEENSWTA